MKTEWLGEPVTHTYRKCDACRFEYDQVTNGDILIVN
jgi:hypothetical protein